MVVKALESGVQGFANAVKRFAIKDKAFAEELAFIHNIRSEITPKALRQITKDMFDKAGKMTESGRQEIQEIISSHGLSKNATWEEILQAVAQRKQQMRVKLVDIPVVKALNIAKVNPENFKKIDFKKAFESILNNP